MNHPPHKPTAYLYFTSEFLAFLTGSGYRTARFDYKFDPIILNPESSNEEIGSLVTQVLSQSRYVHPDDDKELFHFRNTEKRFDLWLESILDDYGYSSKTNALRKMYQCTIEIREEKIWIIPFKKTKLRWWTQLVDQIIVLDKDVSVSNLGCNIRSIMSKCEI